MTDPLQRAAVPAPSLDGLWETLGPAAFAAFVRLTAEAIVTELADGEDMPVGSDRSPRGLARPAEADEQPDAAAPDRARRRAGRRKGRPR